MRTFVHVDGFNLYYGALRGNVLEVARNPGDLSSQPGYRLHPLKGDTVGLWSIRVSGNWRVVFRFEDNEAVDVDLVDYH